MESPAPRLRPIVEIAEALGIPERHLELHGPYKAKIRLEVFEDLPQKPRAKYVAVTALTPTPLGEGKTVTAIGLSLGLNRLGKRAVCTLRQPSLGPFFGVKGGATGGGYCEVVPSHEINLHLTGDFHAVSAAHNLLAAFLDNHLHHRNALGVDPAAVTWRRVVDMNDRPLRSILVNAGTPLQRETGFDITAASEVMAILALATSYRDLRNRLGRIVVARTSAGRPVTAEDLRCAGAMALLLRDALKPNLLQTGEGTPAMIHAGPFANIAHGNSSVLADLVAVRTADFVVTESGFGSDLGYEKFCDIKCRAAGLEPDCAVIVATVRALKVHSGKFAVAPGLPIPEALLREDVESVTAGAANLAHHVDHVKRSGIPVVVAVNRFPTDAPRELDAAIAAATTAGADAVEMFEGFTRGGPGAVALAERVARACASPKSFRFYYDVSLPLRRKIEAIATGVYGADGVDFSPRAEGEMARYADGGHGSLPICMAKTQLSLSHDPALKGRPRGFRIPVREVRLAAGAGFVYPICGAMMTMPGLPSNPGGVHWDIDDFGEPMLKP